MASASIMCCCCLWGEVASCQKKIWIRFVWQHAKQAAKLCLCIFLNELHALSNIQPRNILLGICLFACDRQYAGSKLINICLFLLSQLKCLYHSKGIFGLESVLLCTETLLNCCQFYQTIICCSSLILLQRQNFCSLGRIL